MSVEQNKSIIRRWVAEAWNNGNLALADELYAPDYVYRDPSGADFGRGPASIKQVLTVYRTAIPDMAFTIEDTVGEGDKISWRWTAHGTHSGMLMNIPPSGKSVKVTGILISRFANGLWAEDWNNWDTLGLLQQIGVIPVMS